MIEYDYSKHKYQQEDALPEGALTSVSKGDHVWIAVRYVNETCIERFVCVTGGKMKPLMQRADFVTGEVKSYYPVEGIVIKAGAKDQFGRGNQFVFATEAECQRHVDRLREARS
jgi:hypothetical protein